MFLYIPLFILIAALAGITVIVFRKFEYLRKITPEVLENAGDDKMFLEELVPEITEKINGIALREGKVNLLSSSEKYLRKIRIIWMRIDTWINNLVQGLHTSSKTESEALNKEKKEQKTINTTEEILKRSGAKDLRCREQSLIMQIAKSPTDASLYEQLGDIYVKTGELEDAESSFKKALELNPAGKTIKRKLDKLSKKGQNKN